MWKSKGCSFFSLFMVALFCLIGPKPCSSQDKPEEFIEPYELAKEETFYSKGLFLKEVPLEESPVPASVENLFDKHYQRSGGGSKEVPWGGRRASFDLNFRF